MLWKLSKACETCQQTGGEKEGRRLAQSAFMRSVGHASCAGLSIWTDTLFCYAFAGSLASVQKKRGAMNRKTGRFIGFVLRCSLSLSFTPPPATLSLSIPSLLSLFLSLVRALGLVQNRPAGLVHKDQCCIMYWRGLTGKWEASPRDWKMGSFTSRLESGKLHLETGK